MNINVKSNGKANKIIYLILGALLIAVTILVLLNRGDRELQRALEENREFQVLAEGELVATIGLKTLLEFEPQEFTTPLATSVAAPRDVTLCGVELRVILEKLEIDVMRASRFVVYGLDSYYSPLTREEIEQEGIVYICYSMNGEMLKAQSEGGYGPFLMVIRGSRFAQRWCKYVEAVDVIN